MRAESRIDPMLEEIGAFWHAHPDWRLGQLVANASRAAPYPLDHPFYLEDDDFLKGLFQLS